MNKSNYTSADIDLPIKVLHDTELVTSIVKDNYIPLRHLQLCLTNRCQLNCRYCSCRDRDKGVEMPLIDAATKLREAVDLGCRGVTITGGGEPLLYPHINEVIRAAESIKIKVGLATNGLALGNLYVSPDWCRVSFDSRRKYKALAYELRKAVKRHPIADWAVSFVAYEGLGELKKIVKFANSNKFTHIRIVADILNPDDALINEAKRLLKGIDQLVIYQYRSNPTHGNDKCLISLIKPTVAADGTIFPCCGAQYAIGTDADRDFPMSMSMGKDLKTLIQRQQYFDGSRCGRCYYENYNKLLGYLMQGVEHKEFI